MVLMLDKLKRHRETSVDLSDLVVYEPPTSYLREYPSVDRTFAFLDVSDFTNYTQKYGVRAAAQMLTKFRSAVRIVVGKHRVRVAKWLGDGVMLVGVKPKAVCSAVMEINDLFQGEEFYIHSGICKGKVIIFEGDDYVGRAVNIASRLADNARPAHVLMYEARKIDMPARSIRKKLSTSIQVRGIGELDNVYLLTRR